MPSDDAEVVKLKEELTKLKEELKAMKDIQKFYHGLVMTTTEMGGPHLLSSASGLMGNKLGKIYRKRVAEYETALKSFIKGIGGNPEIKYVEKGFEVQVYSGEYCLIGGEKSEKTSPTSDSLSEDIGKHKSFIHGLCIPYVKGFLKAYDLNAEIESLGCILEGDTYCKFKISF